MLRSIAQALIAAADGDCLVGRFGGDEFVIAAGSCTEMEARRLGQRIHERLERMLPGVSVSIGAAAHKDGEALDDVLRRADFAMFAAKPAYAGNGTGSASIAAVGR